MYLLFIALNFFQLIYIVSLDLYINKKHTFAYICL